MYVKVLRYANHREGKKKKEVVPVDMHVAQGTQPCDWGPWQDRGVPI